MPEIDNTGFQSGGVMIRIDVFWLRCIGLHSNHTCKSTYYSLNSFQRLPRNPNIQHSEESLVPPT